MNAAPTRRRFLQTGLAGLGLPTFLQLRAAAASQSGGIDPFAKAKSCIVLYTWGGMSHLESFDPKPNGPAATRGEFGTIRTATPGLHFCEHLPKLAKHSEKLAIVRSVHHDQGAHQGGMYISLTGHKKVGGAKAKSRKSWPSLPAMISRFQDPLAGTPGAIRLPYAMYDNGTLMAGEYGGWLGSDYDPILMRTPAGTPFAGTSRLTDPVLELGLNLERDRLRDRRSLLRQFEDGAAVPKHFAQASQFNHFQDMAADMLLGSPVREAYDLEREDPRLRAMYGDHLCGQTLLLSRRLVEAGVPVVQALCGAGDLAGGSGDNWDTHRGHFRKMKDRLLPVFDHSVSALLTDLEMRGMLDETLVVFLTDFGRTPKINDKGGRDHHPGVYSVAFAGGGIQGGQVYGASDHSGTEPADKACSPADLHATVFKAMGIHPKSELHDREGRPFQICAGDPLPLSG